MKISNSYWKGLRMGVSLIAILAIGVYFGETMKVTILSQLCLWVLGILFFVGAAVYFGSIVHAETTGCGTVKPTGLFIRGLSLGIFLPQTIIFLGMLLYSLME